MEFTNEGDKKRVPEGRPWVFESSLFLIEDFDGRTSPTDLTFKHAAFWIRMVGLPLACMGRETGRMLGTSVGRWKLLIWMQMEWVGVNFTSESFDRSDKTSCPWKDAQIAGDNEVDRIPV